MKLVLSDITSYFISYYKEKLNIFLNEGGFYNEIKESLSTNTNSNISNIDNNDKDNPFTDENQKKNKIRKTRPQSCDRKRFECFNNEDYHKNNNNYNNNFINYESNAFDAIIKQNREDGEEEGEGNNSDRKRGKLREGFNYINQLNDPNDVRSKGFGSTIKKFFSFKKKAKNIDNNINEDSK